MTIGGSIALIVIGAILRFGITWKPAHVDLQVIGVILMIAGAIGLIIALVFLFRRATARDRGVRGAPLHRTAGLTGGLRAAGRGLAVSRWPARRCRCRP